MNNLIQLVGEDAVTPVAALSGFPVTEEIDLLWRIGLFSSDDERNLRKLWRILKGQTDDYLDMVFGMVAAYPALATTLAAACRENLGDAVDGSTAVRSLFREWLSETCRTPREPSWLKRLYSSGSDLPSERSMETTLAKLPGFRYLIALSFPLVATLRSLLVGAGLAHQEIERMQSAFLKAVLLQVALLSKLYVREGTW
ncbi:MAG: protoglobin domain-containing protein [Candidatus Contendobacter sp.]|nr:protoglobin domain-containing protein [Candidatus Contendobacter sp.]MDG4557942.1 protoglobin domain-containing protein [Candidatus Contendobacter sp.]